MQPTTDRSVILSLSSRRDGWDMPCVKLELILLVATMGLKTDTQIQRNKGRHSETLRMCCQGIFFVTDHRSILFYSFIQLILNIPRLLATKKEKKGGDEERNGL